MSLRRFVALALCAGMSAAAARDAAPDAATRKLAFDVFKQLIEINTTDTPAGNVTTASEAMAKRFLDAGFPQKDIAIAGPHERKKTLVVRYHGNGNGGRPILMICHLDVVEARREDW